MRSSSSTNISKSKFHSKSANVIVSAGCAIFPAIIIAGFSLFTSDSKPKESDSKPQESLKPPLKVTSFRGGVPKDWYSNLSSLGMIGGDFRKEDLVAAISKMEQSELYEVSHSLRNYFTKDPEAAAEYISDLCNSLAASGNQVRALELVSLLQSQKLITDIERKLLDDWSASSWEGVGEYFKKQAVSDGDIKHRQVNTAASIALDTGSQRLEEFLELVGDMKGNEELASLQGTLLGALVRQEKFEHCGCCAGDNHVTSAASEEEEKLDEELEKPIPRELVDLFEENLENIDVVIHLPDYALRYAPEAPLETLEWISSLEFDDREILAHTYGMVMLNEAYKDESFVAVDLLSSDILSTKFYKGEAYDDQGNLKKDAQGFYDEVLGSYLDGLLLIDPQAALDSADAFFSDATQEEYQKRALEILHEVKNEQSAAN